MVQGGRWGAVLQWGRRGFPPAVALVFAVHVPLREDAAAGCAAAFSAAAFSAAVAAHVATTPGGSAVRVWRGVHGGARPARQVRLVDGARLLPVRAAAAAATAHRRLSMLKVPPL